MDANVDDDSGNNNDGTTVGEAQLTSSSKVGDGAYLFDGDGDGADISGISIDTSNTNFTIATWIYTNSSGGQETVMNDNPGANAGHFGIGGNENLHQIRINIGSETYYSSSEVEDQRWNHIAVTVDGSNVRFYLNGSPDGTTAKTTDASFTYNNIGRLQQGDPNTWDLDGALDELGVWDRALSAEEISSLYNSDSGLSLF
jgi:hypothetical protein